MTTTTRKPRRFHYEGIPADVSRVRGDDGREYVRDRRFSAAWWLDGSRQTWVDEIALLRMGVEEVVSS